jgi:hypothetical protein
VQFLGFFRSFFEVVAGEFEIIAAAAGVIVISGKN